MCILFTFFAQMSTLFLNKIHVRNAFLSVICTKARKICEKRRRSGIQSGGRICSYARIFEYLSQDSSRRSASISSLQSNPAASGGQCSACALLPSATWSGSAAGRRNRQRVSAAIARKMSASAAASPKAARASRRMRRGCAPQRKDGKSRSPSARTRRRRSRRPARRARRAAPRAGGLPRARPRPR